jgi:hypothetical protein
MGKIFESVDDKLADWIDKQHIFFVGTAPSGAEGSINVSPKGLAGTFAILGPRQAGYLDYTGSGVETIAHLRDNGRIVFMFCAVEGPPRIVRLQERTRGQRSIIVADLTRISDSCGFSLPLMDYRADRDVLDKVQLHNGDDYYPPYWETKNARSIDGLPGMPVTDKTAQ